MASQTSTPSIPAELAKPDLLRMYERMVLLRRFEAKVQELYRAGRWPGFIHLYIGEEATAVGVCAHLSNDDWIVSTHRGHGHALAKGVPPGAVMAELLGKTTGCSGGRGGSMHMYDRQVGLFGTTGIVASGIPSAVGSMRLGRESAAPKMYQSPSSAMGVARATAVLESLNFRETCRRLPVLFVFA